MAASERPIENMSLLDQLAELRDLSRALFGASVSVDISENVYDGNEYGATLEIHAKDRVDPVVRFSAPGVLSVVADAVTGLRKTSSTA